MIVFVVKRGRFKGLSLPAGRVAKSEDLNLKCGTVCGTKPKRLQTTLRRRDRTRIDVKGATPHCINRIPICENHTSRDLRPIQPRLVS
jgi:hypothetical protein